MYACRRHYYALPEDLKRELWASYRQEPLSDRHIAAMDACDAYLEETYGPDD
jgi:hypothetical protein